MMTVTVWIKMPRIRNTFSY